MPYKDIDKRREHKREYSRRYRQTHKEQIRLSGAISRYQLKYAVLAHYSIGDMPKCAVCGEDDLILLCIDHINGGGNQHRRELFKSESAGGTTIHYWLRDNNFPAGFQVLCWNCNARKAYGGIWNAERAS